MNIKNEEEGYDIFRTMIGLIALILSAKANALMDEFPAIVSGTLRGNYTYLPYLPNADRSGELHFELLQLNLDTTGEPLSFHINYRWYNHFQAVQLMYFEYREKDKGSIQVGLTKVPFGLLPYASHNFWAGATNAAGFEDNYDVGIKYEWSQKNWINHAAYFYSAEKQKSAVDRFSYDITTSHDFQQFNVKRHQLTLRTAYRIQQDNVVTEIGASAQGGGLYNTRTEEMGSQGAVAVFIDNRSGPWHLQGQLLQYDYNPKNQTGVSEKTVLMSAFTYSFFMVSKARISTLNIARTFRPDWLPAGSLTLYNDYSRVDPIFDGYEPSVQNVMGGMFVIKKVRIFADWIRGKNMWLTGGYGIGLPIDASWKTTINLNFGYYF